MPERTPDGYLPIEHYGAIGNLRTVALVGLDGSIDWCCFPELDRPSIFGAILDSKKGGRFRVAPAGHWRSEQRYLEGTNVLETLFEAEGGQLSVVDFMPLYGSILKAGNPPTAPEIHRLLGCEQGEVEFEIEWSPRFDYARATPQIMRLTGGFAAETHGERLSLGGLPADAVEIADGEGGPVLSARLRLSAGERIVLVTGYGSPDARVDLDQSLSALKTTVHAWREWAHHCERPDRRPVAVAVSDSVAYVADFLADQVVKLGHGGMVLGRWGQHGTGPGEFDAPAGVAVDGEGNVFVSDLYNHRIQKFDASGRFRGEWGGKGRTSGRFPYPAGIAVSEGGEVFVADAFNNRVQVFATDGRYLRQWGGIGFGLGGGWPGWFRLAKEVALDRAGNVYVADAFNGRVQKFTPEGDLLAIWDPEDPEVSYPSGIAAGSAGILHVSGFYGNRVWTVRCQ